MFSFIRVFKLIFFILDINECTKNTSGCSNDCINTNGSFSCKCPIGKILDTDLRTCKDCPFNTYGLNCSKTCNCVNALSCNRISGCICISGFTGVYCETDIDECKGLYFWLRNENLSKSFNKFSSTTILLQFMRKHTRRL